MPRRSPRPRRALAAVLAAAAVAAACSPGADDAAPPTTAPTTTVPVAECPVGDDIPGAAPARYAEVRPLEDDGADGAAGEPGGLAIATLLPRTGDLAHLGAPALAAVERAVGELNDAGGVLGGPVTLRHGDSAEGTGAVVGAEVDRLLDEGADVVVGPLSSATAAAVLERVAARGAVLVTPAAASTALDRLDPGGHLLRTVATEALQGRALAQLLLDDGVARADLVVRDDEYGRTVADELQAAYEAGGGTVEQRLLRDPTAPEADLAPLLEGGGEGTVLIGLADTAPVLDALVAADRGPRQHPTYGTDGNLGERLGDLVADRASLACLRGLLATAPVDDDLAAALADEDGALAGGVVLDHAAEAYDAVVVTALAAEAAASAEPAALGAAAVSVTDVGTPCDDPASCLRLLRDGVDLAYVGRSGRLALDARGNRTEAVLSLVAFDADGHLARLGSHAAAP